MNKSIIGIISVIVLLSIVPTLTLAADTSASIPIGPIGPGNYPPTAYMAWRGINIGIDVDGSGSSINPTNIRNSNYAFTGEKIYYYVLARDENGAADINQVSWTKWDWTQEGPCANVTISIDNRTKVDGKNNTHYGDAYFCAGMVNTDPTLCDGNHTVYIDDATNLLYDSQTDEVFQCQLTVESGWSGSKSIFVTVKDQSGATGNTQPEYWNFNPALTISLTTNDGKGLSFSTVTKSQSVPGSTDPNCVMGVDGTKYEQEKLMDRDCDDYKNLGPAEKLCDISFSDNQLILTNTGTVGLWPFIAASNFYDSTDMAKCPFTNELVANQLEYRSIQGSWDSGWRVMPQYSDNLGCTGPGADDTCRGGCRITDGSISDVLCPSASIQTQLKIVWPTPCIGTFDTGTIYMIVRAV